MVNTPLLQKPQQLREQRQKVKSLVLKSNKLLESKPINPEAVTKEQYARK